MRPSRAVLALLTATSLTTIGCSSSDTPARTPAASSPTTTTPVRAAASTSPRGPGQVLGGPLVFRYPGQHAGTGVPSDPGYVVYLRTRGSFAKEDDVGATVPGRLAVLDAVDTRDGYSGAISTGTPSGKCYRWELSSPSPKLDRTREGDKVRTSLTLPKTTVQRHRATLRAFPATSDDRAAQLRRIGCRPRNP